MSINKQKKAVILITIDALRADHLKAYGYKRNTAPNLESFAKDGIIFFNAVTNGPETPTSFSSIFTSILPFLDGGYSPLPSQKIPFPLILKENEILTYCIHSNPNLGRFFNYNRGFDIFLDGERYKKKPNKDKNLSLKQIFSFYIKKIFNVYELSKKLMYRLKGFNKLKMWLRNKIPSLTDILLPFTPIAYNAPYVSNKFVSFLNTAKRPFFAWVHFMDCHNPYNPPSPNLLNFRETDFKISEREFLTKKVYPTSPEIKITQKMIQDLKILYDSEINFIDEYLSKIFRLIKKRFKNDCLVIITSDHGESFYEHGSFGHQGSVYEEVLKIPLIIVNMGATLKKKEISTTVQLLDIMPTILDFFGIDIPENLQGKSIMPILKGEFIKREGYVISECYQKQSIMKRNNEDAFILLAIRKDEWKYIFDEEKKSEFLFNLKSDPLERNNLINKNLEKSKEFRFIKNYHIRKISISSKQKSKIIKAIDLIEKK